MNQARIYHGGGVRTGRSFLSGGGSSSPGLVDSATSRFFSPQDFYTPMGDALSYCGSFLHYFPAASNTFSWPSWVLHRDTDDPMIHTQFMFPSLAVLTVPVKMIVLFAVDDSGAAGTNVQFKMGCRVTPDGSSFSFGPTTASVVKAIAPALYTLYMTAETDVTISGTQNPAGIANIRIRRINGPEGPEDQYEGDLIFLGLRMRWGV